MSKNIFNAVKMTKPPRSKFDLTHDVKLSCNMGQLVPIMCTEALPGDNFVLGCEAMVRFAPLVAPIMHRVDATMHYFFVPNRLLWDGWEEYIVNDEAAAREMPWIRLFSGNYTKLADYMGIPTPLLTNTEDVNALPFAAYQKIYNDYYRDQNLIPEIDIAVSDGQNAGGILTRLTTLRNRAWEHDYFTSALPFAQKGSAVDIPLGVVELDPNWNLVDPTDKPKFLTTAGNFNAGTLSQNATVQPHIESSGAPTGFTAYDPAGTLNVGSTTINDLRRAFRLQEWLEKNARGGTRYTENILAHFGVRSPDARLQRPEYIVGVKQPVQISEVVNTTGTVDAPQGNLAGHGVGYIRGKYGNYYCQEHGFVMGIMSILPKTAYSQGLPKHFTKISDPFQYYWPSFANIGEQAVLNKEVYAFQGAAGENTFGYVPRYAEYRFEQNRVAGDFRESSLDFWHMGRKFAAPPALNAAFVSSDPTHRVFAVTDPDEDKMYCHVLNTVKAIRPMSKFGVPSF